MLRRVLIANRGEIAVRLIRACQQLGIGTTAIFSTADEDALHVRLADAAIWVGDSPAAESYLVHDHVIDAALAAGCDALHPGYGFLAENADFAQRVIDAGKTWIGPPPEAMRRMGQKIAARQTAREAGVPIVPGFESASGNEVELLAAATDVGFPLLVKASAGGGGKGMRLVRDAAALPMALAGAMREAQSAFGDSTVYLERYIERPRHIEVQVLADRHGNVIHLGERECSIQRRHQKVLEETPSPVVSPELRAELGAHAVALARAVGYESAGTVEFIFAPDGGYYFLEMNTRLQVEHPVTELVWGVDLAQWMLRIAAGEQLTLRQEDLAPRGHSIELRVCAEDPARQFLPQTGTVALLEQPQMPGIRIDSGIDTGSEVSPYYDSLLSKFIAWGEDREACIARLNSGLRNYRLLGVTTNLCFLHDLIEHPAFRSGDLHTGFIDEHFADWQWPAADDAALAAAAVLLERGAGGSAGQTSRNGAEDAPALWAQATGWTNA